MAWAVSITPMLDLFIFIFSSSQMIKPCSKILNKEQAWLLLCQRGVKRRSIWLRKVTSIVRRVASSHREMFTGQKECTPPHIKGL